MSYPRGSFSPTRLSGVEYEAFLALKETDKDTYKHYRQLSKAVNFGLPGGLGPDTFVAAAAKPPYNVTITREEAIKHKQTWMTLYPEMRLNLQQVGNAAFETAVVPTGRIRAGIGYCSARNLPFQGLAGDGTKFALWELLKAGYEVCAFIHDEYVIQVSKFMACKQTAEDVNRIICESMAKVCGTIPIVCE